MTIASRWLGKLILTVRFYNFLRMARGLRYGGRFAIAEIAYGFGWPEWYARAVIEPFPGRYLPRGVRNEHWMPFREPWWVRHGEPDPRLAR